MLISLPSPIHLPKSSPSTSYSPPRCSLQNLKVDVERSIRGVSQAVLGTLVDCTFSFKKQPLLPSQSNYAPVEEIGEAVVVTSIEGEIPPDFPEGVYIRNGANPAFGAMLSTASVFGVSSESWIEGEGMLHAVYFTKDSQGKWIIKYKNKYVETDTFKFEKQRGKPSILPAIEGEPSAILASIVLNQLRFGEIAKQFCNTNIIEHSGRIFATSENNLPFEIDVSSLQTCEKWDVNGTWKRRGFISHPKKVPSTGELVIIGMDAFKPYIVLGVISADGERIKHQVDLELERSILCHDVGITERYNVIVDTPMVVSLEQLLRGRTLLKFEEDSYSRIGVMPRYGDSKSLKWFPVQTCCVFHVLNCYEEDDYVVVLGINVDGTSILGPEFGRNKNEWYSEFFRKYKDGLFASRLCEWRLNMETGDVTEKFLTETSISIEFPIINEALCGLRNKYSYVQVVDSTASSNAAASLFGSLSKLYLEESCTTDASKFEDERRHGIKMEIHRLERSHFCSGASFVPRKDGSEEDDGWIISFVHDELNNISHVYILDCKKFGGRPVAKIKLPARVPYGFHGNYFLKDKLRAIQ